MGSVLNNNGQSENKGTQNWHFSSVRAPNEDLLLQIISINNAQL